MRLTLLISLSCALLATASASLRRSKLSQRDAISNSVQAGLFSLTQPDLSNPKNTLNAVIDQYVGILPPVTLTTVQKGRISDFVLLQCADTLLAVTPLLVLPLKDTLLIQAVNNALLSITAAASGNTVTALARLQECLGKQIKSKTGDVTCYTAVSPFREHLPYLAEPVNTARLSAFYGVYHLLKSHRAICRLSPSQCGQVPLEQRTILHVDVWQ